MFGEHGSHGLAGAAQRCVQGLLGRILQQLLNHFCVVIAAGLAKYVSDAFVCRREARGFVQRNERLYCSKTTIEVDQRCWFASEHGVKGFCREARVPVKEVAAQPVADVSGHLYRDLGRR